MAIFITFSVISGGAFVFAALTAADTDASSHFHATITTNNDIYTSGETALVTVKYTIDEGTIAEGDYVIMTIPETIADHVTFSYSHQHFSGIEDLGGGQYKLIFGPDAATALGGSFSARVSLHVEELTTDDITISDGDKEITVLPQGGAGSVICRKMDGTTMSTTDEVLDGAVVTVSGQNISVFLGDIDYPVEISYEVFVPAQSSVRLRNHSEIVYTQDGKTYKESRDYIAQGNDYSAANGVKSVDKTVISNDPDDQWVTYYIKFWNENGFAAG